MFKIFASAATVVAFVFLSGPANATDQNIILTATVAKYCTIAGSATPADDNVTIPVTNGIVDTSLITKSYAVVCNSAASVTLASNNGALLTSTTASSSFDNFINYQAGTSGFANITAAATVNAGAQTLGTVNTSGPSSGTLNVTIQPIAGANPLAGGDYTDTLKVSIVPIM